MDNRLHNLDTWTSDFTARQIYGQEITRIEQDITLIGQETTQLRYMDNRLHNLDTCTSDFTTRQIYGQAITRIDILIGQEITKLDTWTRDYTDKTR